MSLESARDYGAEAGRMETTLADIISSYTVFDNPAEYSVNYLLQGPSGGASIYESQAKANKLISIANTRKDCVACISPYRSGVVGLTNSDTQTSTLLTSMIVCPLLLMQYLTLVISTPSIDSTTPSDIFL